MEKVIYVLWRPEGQSKADFSAALRGPAADELAAAGAKGVQVNVCDDDTEGATLNLKEIDPQMEAVIGVWLDSARTAAREPIEKALGNVASRVAGYVVTESEPMPNVDHPVAPGERTPGFANIAFLRRPERLTEAEWLHLWHDLHTDVAVDTQSTFGYVQNVVVRAVTDDAPAFDGIVEELFPIEALTDFYVFFDAAGDDEKFAKNMGIMNESIERFGANENIDVIATSRYVVKPLTP